VKSFVAGRRPDTLHSLILGALVLALGVALACWPLPWAAVLVSGSLGGLLLILYPVCGLIPLLLSVPLARLGGLMVGGVRVSPAEVMLIGAVLAWLARMAARRRIRLPHPPLLLPLLLLLGTMATSLLGALSLRLGVKELGKWGSIVIAYLVVCACLERKHLGWIIAAIMASGSAQALLGMLQFLTGRGPEGFVLFGRFMRAYGSFEQPNPYGGYLGLTLPVMVALILVSRSRLARLGAVVSALLVIPALAMSWSRGAWLGSASAMLVMGMVYCWCVARGSHRSRSTPGSAGMVGGEDGAARPGGGMKPIVLAGAVVLLLAVALFLGGSWALPSVLTQRVAGLSDYFTMVDVSSSEVTEANYALIERLAHWQAAIRMWADRPWLGVGIGNYAVVYPAYSLPHWPDPLGHAHNYYLNMGAESGLAGLACYIVFLASALWQALEATRDTTGLDRAVALGTLGSIVHLSVHSLFDNLYVHTMYLQVAVMLGLLAVIRRTTDGNRVLAYDSASMAAAA
jgi:putative inorganic carbon (HCO3(-)) transporter